VLPKRFASLQLCPFWHERTKFRCSDRRSLHVYRVFTDRYHGVQRVTERRWRQSLKLAGVLEVMALAVITLALMARAGRRQRQRQI